MVQTEKKRIGTKLSIGFEALNWFRRCSAMVKQTTSIEVLNKINYFTKLIGRFGWRETSELEVCRGVFSWV